MLAFLHVPKTAGTSVRRAIVRATGLTPAEGFDLSAFGGTIRRRDNDIPYRDSIFTAPDEFPRDCGLFSGHVALSGLWAAYPDARHFTLLREPRTRLLSLWLFWRSYDDSALAPWGLWGQRVALARGSFRDFLSDPRIACQTDNICVRMLAWPHRAIPDQDFIAPEAEGELLAIARRNLARLDFVGCTEDPRLGARLGAFIGAPLDIGHNNGTGVSPFAPTPRLAEEMDEPAVAALAARTRLDALLWADVAQEVGLPLDAQALSEISLLRRSLHYAGEGIVYASAAGEAAAAAAAKRLAAAEADARREARRAADAEASLAAARAALAAERHRYQVAQAHIAALEASRSWRITAPLRRLSQLRSAPGPSA